MSPVNALIAEDEANLREQLRQALHAVWPEVRICAEARDGLEALRAMEAYSPNVMFLDVQMPGMNGLEVARRASGRCHVVFVTAYDKYAVAAFEQEAVDYVMKPLTTARLAESVRRLQERLHSTPANLEGLVQALAEKLAHRPGYLRWITATLAGETRIITTDEVVYLKSDNKYTLVITADKELVIRSSIKELLERLDPEAFWQIHRGIVVNVAAIAGVSRSMTGHLDVRLKVRKETLPVSESYAHLFKNT